jgi:hypothetical protein
MKQVQGVEKSYNWKSEIKTLVTSILILVFQFVPKKAHMPPSSHYQPAHFSGQGLHQSFQFKIH